MQKLTPKRRHDLSVYLTEARERLGFTRDLLAEKAEDALRSAAYTASEEDRLLYARVEITTNHIIRLENFPATPMSTAARRARLMGVALALKLDLATVNHMAGGL